MKKRSNLTKALLISLALTGLVFLYFLISGQSMQVNELMSYVAGLFGGILVYLWFVGRRRK
ncbi:hypothetical protein ACUNV4_07980 [Granulosicoccus sp. 3-233]|uniref:hypothetical protein n=1 Tax=Granulosicoccus sp. 3-233 TaxID=3417969 RepID=UPI003D33EE91